MIFHKKTALMAFLVSLVSCPLMSYQKEVVNTTNKTVKIRSTVGLDKEEVHAIPPKGSITLESPGALCWNYIYGQDEKGVTASMINPSCNGFRTCIGYKDAAKTQLDIYYALATDNRCPEVRAARAPSAGG